MKGRIKKQIKKLVNLAWNGEINPWDVYEKVKEIGGENFAIYVTSFPYAVLYFNYQGKVHALPWWKLENGEIKEENSYPQGVEIFTSKEDAKDFSKFGRFPYQGEEVASIVIEKIENVYGKEVPVKERAIFKHQGKYYLDERALNCWSSWWLGLGTCQCFSHQTYREFIVKEIKSPTNEQEILEILQE